jgi:hypothetical protein
LTVTVRLQDEVRCRASVAVQVTVVEPIAKTVPLAGVHAMFKGDWPPTTLGVPYTTGIGLASGDVTASEAGHVIVGGSTGVGVGIGGVSLLHPDRHAYARRASPWSRVERNVRFKPEGS